MCSTLSTRGELSAFDLFTNRAKTTREILCVHSTDGRDATEATRARACVRVCQSMSGADACVCKCEGSSLRAGPRGANMLSTCLYFNGKIVMGGVGKLL